MFLTVLTVMKILKISLKDSFLVCIIKCWGKLIVKCKNEVPKKMYLAFYYRVQILCHIIREDLFVVMNGELDMNIIGYVLNKNIF